MKAQGSSWRWDPAEHIEWGRTSMDVLVPDPSRTIAPFGFARALSAEQSASRADRDCWDDHADAVAGADLR